MQPTTEKEIKKPSCLWKVELSVEGVWCASKVSRELTRWLPLGPVNFG